VAEVHRVLLAVRERADEGLVRDLVLLDLHVFGDGGHCVVWNWCGGAMICLENAEKTGTK
jgi:hypothetical protein